MVDENNVSCSVANPVNLLISTREVAVDACTSTLDYHCDRGRTLADVTNPQCSQPPSNDCLSSANYEQSDHEHSNAELLIRDDPPTPSHTFSTKLHSLHVRKECTSGIKLSRFHKSTQSPPICHCPSVMVLVSNIADGLLKVNSSLSYVNSCADNFLHSLTRPTCAHTCTELAGCLINEPRNEEIPKDTPLMDQPSPTYNVLLNPAIVVG